MTKDNRYENINISTIDEITKTLVATLEGVTMDEGAFAIDGMIQETEGASNNRIAEAVKKSLEVASKRNRKGVETMTEEQSTSTTPTAVTTKPATPKAVKKVTAKPKAKAKVKPAMKSAKKTAKPKAKSTSKHKGRQAKYTREMILGLVKTAKSQGKSLRVLVESIVAKEKAKLTKSQRKGFKAAVSYVPILVAATRNGLSLRKLMAK